MRGPKRISGRIAGRIAGTIVAAVTAGLVAAPMAAAQDGRISVAEPKQLGLMEPATETMERLVDFHDLLLIVITAITALVFVLLGWIAVRYNRRANPSPSRVSHNTLLEIVWTVVPVMILVVIAIPSMKLLYAQDVIPEADMTIKTIGKQWYWTYEYPDHGNFVFDAFMLQDEEAAEQGLPRLLATDRAVVIPVDTTVRILVTAGDVLHSFAVPAFGIKIDAVPGRLNETWVHVTEEGTYYGQCSELCGTGHAYMPIMFEVVSQAAFDAWVSEQQAALLPEPGARQLADAEQIAR